MAKYQLNILFDESIDADIRDYYINYTTKHEGDSGIDLVCVEEVIISSVEVHTLNFKIKCEMINLETNKLVSYYLYPRSSISNYGILLANSVGIIDAGYRGCIMAKVRKIDHLFQATVIKKLNKLFQLCAPDLGPIKICIVDELSSSTRGEGGFGSTGV